MSNLPQHLVFFSFLFLQAAFVFSQLSCPPSFCGNLEIKYPLWLKNSPNSNPTDYYCGFPDLGVDCVNNEAILHAGNDTFVVESFTENNIGYIFKDRDVLGSPCLRARHNLTLDSDPRFPLRLGGSFSIFFYFNCTVKDYPPPPGYVSLPPCIRNGERKESFALWSDGNSKFEKYEGMECEDIVVSPVKKPLEAGNLSSGFPGALKGGFEMVLSPQAKSQCAECEKTNRTCMYVKTEERENVFYCTIGEGSKSGDYYCGFSDLRAGNQTYSGESSCENNYSCTFKGRHNLTQLLDHGFRCFYFNSTKKDDPPLLGFIPLPPCFQ